MFLWIYRLQSDGTSTFGAKVAREKGKRVLTVVWSIDFSVDLRALEWHFNNECLLSNKILINLKKKGIQMASLVANQYLLYCDQNNIQGYHYLLN